MHPKCDHLLIFCIYSVDAHAQMAPKKAVSNAYTDFESRLATGMQNSGRGSRFSCSVCVSTSSLVVVLPDTVEIRIRFCPWLYSCITSQAFLLPQTPSKSSNGRRSFGNTKAIL